MIKINFAQIYVPVDGLKTSIKVEGLVITYNGESYDLSEIPNGATVDHKVIQKCTRNGNYFELTLVVNFTGQLPDNYGKMDSVEINSDWELKYEHTKGGLSNDLA